MCAEPALPASQSPADQPFQEAKRLPGLWVICVLFGLSGMLCVTGIFVGTPLGIVIAAVFALADFAAAVALWRRSRAAWIAVVVFLLLKCVAWGYGFSRNPMGGGALDALPFALNLWAIAYLWLRRKHFGSAARPPAWRPSAAAALGITVVIGVGWTMISAVDDARESFPQLQVKTSRPPDNENAYIIFEQISDKLPEGSDDATWQFLSKPPVDPDHPPAGWQKKATSVLSNCASCLSLVDDMLSKPVFAPTEEHRTVGNSWQGGWWDEKARALAEVLALRSDLEISQGQSSAAMHDAESIVRMGVLLMSGCSNLIDYLSGAGVYSDGLEQVNRVASSATARAGLLKPMMDRLNFTDALHWAAVRAMATEFRFDDSVVTALSSTSTIGQVDPEAARSMGSAAHLLRKTPFLKPNMTYNELGRIISGVFRRLERFSPGPYTPYDYVPEGLGFIRQVGWLRFLRNSIGEIVVMEASGNLAGAANVHFEDLARLYLTRLHLALRCYQLDHGKLPGALADLSPQYLKTIPLDPFTGKPFGYEPTGKEPRIWSVGPDQRTDSPGTKRGDDIVVSLVAANEKPSDSGE